MILISSIKVYIVTYKFKPASTKITNLRLKKVQKNQEIVKKQKIEIIVA